MIRTKEKISDVVQDCLGLSDGTIATLTGLRRYEDIDRVQAELVQLALEMPTAQSWMEVWEEYLKRRSIAMEKWQVVDLDVWGNEEDGFEVNNVFRLDIYIDLPEDFTKTDVIKALKQVGYLKKHIQNRQLSMEDNEDFILIEQTKNGCPVCYLYKVKENKNPKGGIRNEAS